MTTKDRFQEFLVYYGLNQSGFARKTSYKQRNLSNFLSGYVAFPRIDLLIALTEHFPDVSINWLLTGEGDMLRTATKKENEELKKENADLRDLIKSKDKIISLLENQ